VNDSWHYPESEKEGELLGEAIEKGVRNAARYFHHKMISVGHRDDDIRANIRKGLDIRNATNYKLEKPIPPASSTGRRVSRMEAAAPLRESNRRAAYDYQCRITSALAQARQPNLQLRTGSTVVSSFATMGSPFIKQAPGLACLPR
jgi:hypothetical protein